MYEGGIIHWPCECMFYQKINLTNKGTFCRTVKAAAIRAEGEIKMTTNSLEFSGAPFNLDADAHRWIDSKMNQLTTEAKAALVFSVMSFGPTVDRAQFGGFEPGFISRMDGGTAEQEQAVLEHINANFTVPVTFSTDLEGSTTTPGATTPAPVPMSLAAANDPVLTEAATAAMAQEAAEYGIRWSFTPALDLNIAFRSSITGSRSYGSDLEKVRAHALATLRGLQQAGTAATAKHWPGEGYDDRDQHLVTTVNPLSYDEWEATFGSLYRDAIDAGVMAIMPAHIAFPAYMREIEKCDGEDVFLPATLNAKLNENLLRKRLGFNGILVSDATAMAGISSIVNREDLVIGVLNAGCDVILDSKNLPADVASLTAAVSDGRLSMQRLDQAVRRQLALKAALGLHIGNYIPAFQSNADSVAIQTVMENAPTLVKSGDDLFPITPARYGKIYLVSRGVLFPPASTTRPLPFAFADKLRAAGFEVVEHEWGTPVVPEGCDLLLYAYAEECLLTRGTITNDWAGMTGQFQQAMKRHWNDLPCLMISFGWPYHLYEANRIHGYINAYMAHPETQRIVIDAMMGKTAFKGVSPVDPFCGLDPAYFQL